MPFSYLPIVSVPNGLVSDILPSFASIVTECRLSGISGQQTVPVFLPYRIRDPENDELHVSIATFDRAQYCNGAGVDLTSSDGDLGYTERVLFKGAAQTAFSVFLAGGLVVDVTSDKRIAPGIRPFTLPVAIPDTSVGTALPEH
jgi:hypothetical protein